MPETALPYFHVMERRETMGDIIIAILGVAVAVAKEIAENS